MKLSWSSFLQYPTHALPTLELEYKCELAALIGEGSKKIELGQYLCWEPEEPSDDGPKADDRPKADDKPKANDRPESDDKPKSNDGPKSDDGPKGDDSSEEESELEDEETFKAKLTLIYTMIEDQLAIKMELQAELLQIKKESQKWISEMNIALEDHSNLGSQGNKEEDGEEEEAYLGTLAGKYQRTQELSQKHQNDIQTLFYDIELWEQNVAKAIQWGGY